MRVDKEGRHSLAAQVGEGEKDRFLRCEGMKSTVLLQGREVGGALATHAMAASPHNLPAHWTAYKPRRCVCCPSTCLLACLLLLLLRCLPAGWALLQPR